MDIQEKQAKWKRERPLFEAVFIHSHLLPFFNFNENTGDYEIKSEYENDEDRALSFNVLNTGWAMWLRAKRDAKAQAVPEGFVLVPEDKAKDTERLNFLLGDDRYIRTAVKRDIQNEDYEKIGEHYLFTEVYWIDGWDYHENTSSDTERGAIDKAIIEAQEQGHV